jgi:integrase
MALNCLHGLKTIQTVRAESPKKKHEGTGNHNPHHHRTTEPFKESGATTPTNLEVALFGNAIPKMSGELEPIRLQVLETIRNRWAISTTQSRNRLYNELLGMASLEPGLPLQTTAALMVQRKGVTIQTKLSYAKNLHAILRQLNQETELLSSYIAGLRAMGAEIPQKQAAPITRDVLENIVCPPPVKVALLMAWKTASRLDEIARLTPESIVESTPSEVIIWFGRHTKTSRSRPLMPQLFQVIRGEWTEFIHNNLPEAFRNWPTTAAMARHLPQPYTMHSIKHGAAQTMLKLAAEGKVDLSLIPTVLKHASAQRIVSETTVRYMAQSKADLARTFRTGEVTQHL